MLNFLSLEKEAFGLDISELSLKIIKLQKRKGFLSLASFGEFPLQAGVISGGEIRDKDALAQAIHNACAQVKGKKLGTRRVVISLPEEKSFLQVIPMPSMRKEELEKSIHFEAENYIPLPINDVYLDSQIVPFIQNHRDHINVLIAALPKATVDPYVEVLKKADLLPEVLEVESLAVARAIVQNQVSSQPILLVDLGATRTGFIIFYGYAVRFTSSIPVSSSGFTETIARHLQASPKEAEKLKIKYGLSKKDKDGKKVFDALIPGFTDLLEQIKKYIDYYQTHASNGNIDGKLVSKVLLCGGGANLKSLPDFLSLELKIPVELANPWINILPHNLKEIPEISFKESLSYTTALGLALKGIRNN